ncbi:hypothetical protein, partial [Paenibacillus lactis]|uniref:hypothetical protein n=1 Tax=Paenibacillus lactis TaxID=228574 RepID=UPI001ABF4C0E
KGEHSVSPVQFRPLRWVGPPPPHNHCWWGEGRGCPVRVRSGHSAYMAVFCFDDYVVLLRWRIALPR